MFQFSPQFFEKEGLTVSGAFVFIDRDQGGKERVQHINGVPVYW